MRDVSKFVGVRCSGEITGVRAGAVTTQASSNMKHQYQYTSTGAIHLRKVTGLYPHGA